MFRSALRYGEVNSQACIPVMGSSGILGTVLLYESDAAQAAMIDSLRRNLVRISLVTSAGAVFLGLVLGFLMSRRTRNILAGIRGIGSGRYETRITDKWPDELGELSGEINLLADRLQQTESPSRRIGRSPPRPPRRRPGCTVRAIPGFPSHLPPIMTLQRRAGPPSPTGMGCFLPQKPAHSHST